VAAPILQPSVPRTWPEIKQTVCHNHENHNLPGRQLRRSHLLQVAAGHPGKIRRVLRILLLPATGRLDRRSRDFD